MRDRSENYMSENVNQEQEDDAQVLDASELLKNGDDESVEESRKAPNQDSGEIFPDDVPDLVDKMNEMLASGRIDNGAFAGEPAHDDEESTYRNSNDGDDEA